MKRYNIIYHETYSDTYEVEAETYEEACETLGEMLANGEEKGPDNCIDSGYEYNGEEDCEDYDEVAKLKEERDRFITIAYNAIVFGKLQEHYDDERLMEELGCSEEEYEKLWEF
jgi:hypothetical protein